MKSVLCGVFGVETEVCFLVCEEKIIWDGEIAINK